MDKIFKIGLFGLVSNEQKTLGSIFKLAASRSRQYSVVISTERHSADIVLVDIDDANSLNEWRSFSVHHSQIPVVKVTKTAPDKVGENEIYLRRPLTLKRVLETLDKVTIEVHKYVPELVVGGEEVLGEEAHAVLSDAAKSAGKVSLTGIKALVVDDALSVRKSMEIQLGLFGMEIDFAETGEEAVEYIQKNSYDIIFLDLMLPGIDGYKVCKEIKSNKPSKNTPVIMLTGKGSRFDKLKGAMAGANEYLTKPVEQAQLKEVINKYLPNIKIS
jgi:twitching motility two-component system response regulator PilG